MIWRLGEAHFLVLDRVASAETRHCRLHWLLGDFPTRGEPASGLTLNTPQGDYVVQLGRNRAQAVVSMARGDAASIRGWRSPDYGAKVPALSLALEFLAPGDVVWSLFGPSPARAWVEDDQLIVETAGGRARFTLNGSDPFPICRRAEWSPVGQNLIDSWSADA
jgi:hypothetical protein